MLSKYKFKTKYLINKKIKKAGRNNSGKITVYHQGGGHKQLYRVINFNKFKIPGIITNIEYDPNRSSNIAKICFFINNNKYYYYILAPKNLKVLDRIFFNQNINKIGNIYLLNDLNIGDYIYNIEMQPNQGAKIARSAGTYCQIIQKNDKHAVVKLPSGEERLISINCKASLGVVSNENKKNLILKKAGKSRWLNKRPTVRGVAMNPVDHPHGGGEGKSSGGRPSVTPWSKYTKGKPTRSKKKNNKFILKPYKSRN